MTHYEILGVKKTASNEEIKDAYKKLVKKFHPDVYTGDKTLAEKKIKEINEAYDILSNPDLKKEYDEKINPQNTGYSPNNYSSYTYSSPNYNSSYYSHKTTTSKRNAQARGSKYSYENYKRTYNNSTNYGSYDYQKRYTNYHRSKTPNSNYAQNNTTNKYTEKVVDTIFNFSNSTKVGVLFLIIIMFIIFFIINIMQITSLFGGGSSMISSSTSTSSKASYNNKTKTNTSTTKNNSQTRNPYLNETKTPSTTNGRSDIPSLEDFDINEYFSDSEIMQAYTAYGYTSYSSFDTFKEALKEAFYEAYILHY